MMSEAGIIFFIIIGCLVAGAAGLRLLGILAVIPVVAWMFFGLAWLGVVVGDAFGGGVVGQRWGVIIFGSLPILVVVGLYLRGRHLEESRSRELAEERRAKEARQQHLVEVYEEARRQITPNEFNTFADWVKDSDEPHAEKVRQLVQANPSQARSVLFKEAVTVKAVLMDIAMERVE